MDGQRAILFDLGGVLIEWEPRHLYRSLFADPAEMERFLAEVCHPRWNWTIDAGKPFLEAVRERQAEVPEYEKYIGYWYYRWREMLVGEIPGTVGLLWELKELGTPLYALTNWSRETFPKAKERFGFLEWFRHIVVSGDVGVAKPDPRIYQLAIERCRLTPAETVFIDDVQANVDAARQLGFDAIRFVGAEALRQNLMDRGFLGAPGTGPTF